MGVFEKLPYLNYHDINLDWLVKQTKNNASDNTYLMKIFKWFQDQGLVGVVTDITENPDDTVKIDYTETVTQTTDDFTVYNKNGVDGLVSGLDGRLDTAEGNITSLYGIADFKLNAYTVGTGLPTKTLTLPSAYAPFIAFGLYEGAVTCHVFTGSGGTSLNVAKLVNTNATLPFINVDTNKFTFTSPTATNLTIMGLNITVT